MNQCAVLSLFTYLLIVNVDAADLSCKLQPSWNRWIADKIFGWKVMDLIFSKRYNLAGGNQEVLAKFWLHTKNTLINPEEYYLNSSDKMFTNFDNRKSTKIVIHGWIGSHTCKYSQNLVNAFLSKYDYNIIVVDWKSLARRFYPKSRQAVPIIGEILAQFIDLLYKTYNTKPESLHLIGFSLGAHVTGVAGCLITSGSIGRITGLDPALPMFAEEHQDRLTRDAANFVDVIHTCGNYLGWFTQTGHADFYPNNGLPIQPGCGMDVLGKCSHQRAWMYYAESIEKPDIYMAYACDSWDNYEKGLCKKKPVTMGENLDASARGTFYLETNKVKPFGKGNHYS